MPTSSYTEERPPDSQYVTLSHCWGQIPIKTLLEANISKFTEGIDAAELPKTFRDAIVIARRLGVPFLWIDSLCIIQDSAEDWAKESSSMANVYRNSPCNIAATAARDGRTGCFLAHNSALARTCRLRIDGLPGPAPKSKLYDPVQSNFWRYGIDFQPLIHRGWILQERVLAPRVIYFGRSQLLWECYELVSACHLSPRCLCYDSYIEFMIHIEDSFLKSWTGCVRDVPTGSTQGLPSQKGRVQTVGSSHRRCHYRPRSVAVYV